MKKMKESFTKLNNALYFTAGAMVVILAFIIVVGVQTKAQNADREDTPAVDNTVSTENLSEEEPLQEKWQEGVVSYKGNYYKYNSNLKIYLMMGIDKDEPVETITDYTQGGQSDAMFLLVVDQENEKLSVVSINRNTMTDITLCDADGINLGTINSQICLQHAFGDGKKLSCSRSVDAVAKLFGNIPINGYLAMNMGAIPLMNDAVGGVELTVLQNLSYPDAGVNLKKGQKVTLSGTEAYYYLHGRDVSEYNSATARLRREEQYIVAYMDQLKKAAGGSASAAVAVYNSIADYLVSSVDFTSLIEELANYDFTEDQMYTVPGETEMGEPIDGLSYEEYHVDEEAMQELIMQIFYQQVEEPAE